MGPKPHKERLAACPNCGPSDYPILILAAYRSTMNSLETSDPPYSSRMRRRSALLISGLAFVWWVIDLNVASTILVTPVSSEVWWLETILGAVVGLRIGYLIADGEPLTPLANGRMPNRKTLMVLLCVVGLGFGAMAGNRAMWCITNAVCFWGSSAPISVDAFPIRDVSIPRGGPVVSIGSEGEADSLPISKNDLQLLGGPRRLHRPWIYCLNLQRQVQGNAVRVWRPRRLLSSSKKLTVTRCPTDVRWI